jgi:hypothetical protein
MLIFFKQRKFKVVYIGKPQLANGYRDLELKIWCVDCYDKFLIVLNLLVTLPCVEIELKRRFVRVGTSTIIAKA